MVDFPRSGGGFAALWLLGAAGAGSAGLTHISERSAKKKGQRPLVLMTGLANDPCREVSVGFAVSLRCGSVLYVLLFLYVEHRVLFSAS